MSDVRCRACGAAVPEEAQWCSLCFADLRVPNPALEPVSVPAAPSADDAASASPVAQPAPTNGVRPDPDALLGLPERPAEQLAVRPAEAATPVQDGTESPAATDGSDAEETDEAKWPCLRCGEQVGISLDACPACGAGFLSGSTTAASVRLPVVGDIERLSRSQRLLVGLAISFVVMIALVLIATIGGHIFH